MDGLIGGEVVEGEVLKGEAGGGENGGAVADGAADVKGDGCQGVQGCVHSEAGKVCFNLVGAAESEGGEGEADGDGEDRVT